MKRVITSLAILACFPNFSYGNINITEGSGKVVAADSVSSTEFQKIKICDGATGSSTCFSTAPVSIIGSPSITGTVTANQGTAGTTDWPVRLTSTTITNTVTVNGSGVTQPVSGTVAISNMFSGTTVYITNPTTATVSGTVTANISGSISNTSFAVSTGGVTSAQGPPGTQDWPVRLTSTTILGTVTVNGSGVTQPVSGTFWQATQPISGSVTAIQGAAGTTDWPVRLTSTTITNTVTVNGSGVTQPVSGTVTSNQGTAGTIDWPVRVSSTNVSQSTVTIMAPNNNTTPIPVTGSFSASSVNITTAAPNAALPIAGTFVGGVGPTGLFQSFAVNASSALQITGSISSTPGPISVANVSGSTLTVGYQAGMSSVPVNVVNTITATAVAITTGQFNQSFPGVGAAIAYVGPTGLTQAGAVDVSSRQIVVISTGGVSAAQSGTWTVQPGNTANSTAWKVDGSAVTQPISGSISNTSFAVSNLFNGTTFYQVNPSTVTQGTAGTQDWPVRLTSTTITNTVTVNGSGVTQPVSGTFWQATQPISGTVSVSTGGVTAAISVLVSSNTTIPATISDAIQVPAMGDNEGRIVVMSGVPTALALSTSPAAITGTGYIVLVASPASTVFTHMCGCSIGNTSATNTYVTFYPSGNSTTSNLRRMMAPANNFPTGYAMDCSRPFLNTTSGGVQVTVTAAAAVSSLFIDCLYYQSTSP